MNPYMHICVPYIYIYVGRYRYAYDFGTMVLKSEPTNKRVLSLPGKAQPKLARTPDGRLSGHRP